MAVPRAPRMLPLICYEIIFPGDAMPEAQRPGWLVNLTNDGWFGISSGPYQHLQQARVRAIEEGLPLVRAANTGISAVVDPVGRIVNSLPLGTRGRDGCAAAAADRRDALRARRRSPGRRSSSPLALLAVIRRRLQARTLRKSDDRRTTGIRRNCER